jgi:DNA-binding PadR family transcriptional regulator
MRDIYEDQNKHEFRRGFGRGGRWNAMRGGGGMGGRGGRGGPRGGDGFDGGGGHGRRRMFESGELRLVLLQLLEERARHGYDFIREIDARTGGAYSPSPGIIYPTLTMLEELGQIEAQAIDGGKRMFAITATGRAHLEERRAETDHAMRRLDVRSDRWSEAGPVWRAMQNLKTVLRGKLSADSDQKTLLAVSDLLDEAARKIERLD